MSNVYISGFADLVDVEHDETISFVGTALKATDVNLVDFINKTKGKATDPNAPAPNVSAIIASESSTATGAGNSATIPTWAAGWTLVD